MKAKEQHVDALKQSKNHKNSNISSKISTSFKKLTNSEKLNRINGAVCLLQHLKEIKIDENQVCVITIHHHHHDGELIKTSFFFFF